MSTVSLMPIDVGFDPRAHGMSVDLSAPGVDRVDYEDDAGVPAQARGSKTRIAAQLADAGFQRIVVERTPNGREIVYEAADQQFHVQPADDDYWITVDDIGQARDAYENPAKYRTDTDQKGEPMKNVVTYQDDRGGTINICDRCEQRLTGNWPRNRHGAEYATVSHGRHVGQCDACSDSHERATR